MSTSNKYPTAVAMIAICFLFVAKASGRPDGFSGACISADVVGVDDGSKKDSMANLSEEHILVQRLEQEGLISQVKGFVVEKQGDKLFIDGHEQVQNLALKCLSGLKKEYIQVTVYPFLKRLEMHPDAGFMQVLLPESFSSPCVEYKPKPKPGC